MPSAPETPPDQAITDILDAFIAGRSPHDEASRDLARAFACQVLGLEDHLHIILADVRAHRITADEARRDLSRAAAAARKGDRHFLALLAPVHA